MQMSMVPVCTSRVVFFDMVFIGEVFSSVNIDKNVVMRSLKII